MNTPALLEVAREALEFLEEEFPVLHDPPATTREAAVAVLCWRLRFVLESEALEIPVPSPDFDPLAEEDPFPEDLGEWVEDPPVGEEYRPYGWCPYLWDDLDHPDTDAGDNYFSDLDPGL